MLAMREAVKALSAKIDEAKNLCKNVLDIGEKIKALSPSDMDMNMDAYADELTRLTESRGRATRTAIQEIRALKTAFDEIQGDPASSAMEKAFLEEKISSVQAMAPQFVQQNGILRKNIEKHLTSMRQESVEFHRKVDVIKKYLKTPDKKTFYG